jgi:O-antigen ligase
MQTISGNNHFRDLFAEGNYFEKWLKIIFFSITVALTVFLIYSENWIAAGGITGGILVVYLILVKPAYWIYVAVMFFPVYAHSRKADVGPEDIVAAVIYNAILFIWFFSQIFIYKRKIIHNLADWIILFLFLVLILHSSINIFNDSDFLTWLREYLVLSIILMYFPVRYYIQTRKQLKVLLIVFSFSTIVNSGLQFKFFYDLINSIDLNYAYQLLTGLRINQFYFTSAALFGLFYFFAQKKLWQYLYLAAVTILSFGAMFISLSRTYWVFFAFGVVMYFFFLTPKKKIIFLQFSGIAATLLITFIFTFWQENAQLYLKALQKRFLSTTKTSDDTSFKMRMIEYDAAFERIKLYPIGGNGLNKKYYYFDQYRGFTHRHSNIHNGYISLTYRVGFVLAFVYFLFYFVYLYKIIILIPKARDELLRPLALGTLAVFLLFFASNLTSGQFIYKEAVFTMGFVLAFVGIIENILKNDNLNYEKSIK